MNARRAAAALAAMGIAATLRAAEPEQKTTAVPEQKTTAVPEVKKPEGPTPPPENEKLNYFVAPWTSEGTVKPGPDGPGGQTQGRAMCRWMPGKFFLACMMESKDAAGAPTQVQSMLGWDTEKQVFRSWSFDNHGRFEAAIGTFKDDTWTWVGESHRGGKIMQMRYVVSDAKPDAYAFSYETSPDGKTWTTDWSGKYSKMMPRSSLTPGVRPTVIARPGLTPTPAPK